MSTQATIPPPPPGYGTPSVMPPPPPGYGDPMIAGPDATATTPPPAAAAPAAPASMFDRAMNYVKSTQKANEDALAAHPVLHAIASTLNAPNEMISGAAKSAMNGMGGLLHIVHDQMGEAGSPSDMIEYQQEHPEASQQEAVDAVGKGYRGKTTTNANSDLKSAADWLTQHGEEQGFWQHAGGAAELVGELLSPLGVEEAPVEGAKVMTYADRMAQQIKTAKFLEGNPKIAKLAAIGARAVHAAVKGGVEAGGQTYLHSGGDVGQTEEAAALGGAAAPLAEGAAAGVSGVLRRMAKPAITGDAIREAAQGTVADRLAETNATRTNPGNALPPSTGSFEFNIQGPPTQERVEGDIAHQPRKKQIGTQYAPGKGSGTQANVDDYPHGTFQYGDQPPLPHVDDREPFTGPTHKEPVYQYLTAAKPGGAGAAEDVVGGGGTLKTNDPDLAASHLASLNKAISSPEFAQQPAEQQSATIAARDDIREQLGQYYQHEKATGTYKPNFAPVNAQQAIRATATPRDAAEQLEDAGREVYEHANRVSGGQWQVLKDHIQDLGKKLANEPDVPSNRNTRSDLAGQISEAKQAMSKILEDPRNGIDQTDTTQAIKNFRAGFMLRDLHEAIKPIYGSEEQTGLTTGQYRGFDGNRIGARFEAFLRENPDARQTIGPDRVDTLRQIFRANNTLASRSRFGKAVLNVAKVVGGGGAALAGHKAGGYGGAAAAEAAYLGIQHVMSGLVSNPNAAKNLLFAIDSGARPENYAPIVAKLIDSGKAAARAAIPAAAGAAVRASTNQGER